MFWDNQERSLGVWQSYCQIDILTYLHTFEGQEILQKKKREEAAFQTALQVTCSKRDTAAVEACCSALNNTHTHTHRGPHNSVFVRTFVGIINNQASDANPNHPN